MNAGKFKVMFGNSDGRTIVNSGKAGKRCYVHNM